MPEESVGAADKANCTCEPCKRKDGLAHNLRDATIHSYTSVPRNGWVPRLTSLESAQSRSAYIPTFGVELETQAPVGRPMTDLSGRPIPQWLPFDPTQEQREAYSASLSALSAWEVRNRAHRERQLARRLSDGFMTAQEAASIGSPRGLWHAKHDGSVTGPEFASQPATLAYWRNAERHLTEMFKSLLHGGFRSHDGDTCGLHVNIGSRAFTNEYGDRDADHLYRFATLVTLNPRWSTRMSQRTHSSVSHWSRFDALDTDVKRRDWADEWARYGYVTQNRYCVLNASNEGRIEFRMPRGTLRIDRFYAKLEWTAAMVEYTRDADNVLQVSAFMRWADASGDYPYLARFMRERFAGRFESASVAESTADRSAFEIAREAVLA